MGLEIISTDPDRPGIFAVGQLACGIFSLGQLSTGVIAIGQVARGVIAIGQGAVGIVAIGQGAIGVLYAGGMMAVGGRGFGICLKVLPKITITRHQRPNIPPLSSLDELEDQARGWLLVEVKDGKLMVDDREAPLELREEARAQIEQAVLAGHNFACVTVETEDRIVEPESAAYRQALGREKVLWAKRLSSWYEGQPRVHLEGPLTSVGGLMLRAIGAFALGAAWWVLAGQDIYGMFFK